VCVLCVRPCLCGRVGDAEAGYGAKLHSLEEVIGVQPTHARQFGRASAERGEGGRKGGREAGTFDWDERAVRALQHSVPIIGIRVRRIEIRVRRIGIRVRIIGTAAVPSEPCSAQWAQHDLAAYMDSEDTRFAHELLSLCLG
jgi:hypothetical protein